MRSLHGVSIFYGHEVTMETLGLEFQSFVFFAAEKGVPRNLLGRVGWLQLVRLAVIDYEQGLDINWNKPRSNCVRCQALNYRKLGIPTFLCFEHRIENGE